MRYVPRGKPFHGTVAQVKRNAAASEPTHAATTLAASRAPA